MLGGYWPNEQENWEQLCSMTTIWLTFALVKIALFLTCCFILSFHCGVAGCVKCV